MLIVSLTRFARFCSSTNASRAVAARETITGNDGQDVYLPLKQAVREVVVGGDVGVFERLKGRMEGTRLATFLPAVLPQLAKFLGRADSIGPGVTSYLAIAPGLGVRVNPELRATFAGKVYHVKLWFRMDPPDDDLVESITALIFAANGLPGTIPAVLDVRRMRLRTGVAKREDHRQVVMADGAAFAVLVNKKQAANTSPPLHAS